ncbi:hypothetical protein BDZ89DRAFT_1186888 [Hymenopellis radicata]|nr:hypothetical protein BDZ89DRAFT_1186888 [Hymenopellis radicata]
MTAIAAAFLEFKPRLFPDNFVSQESHYKRFILWACRQPRWTRFRENINRSKFNGRSPTKSWTIHAGRVGIGLTSGVGGGDIDVEGHCVMGDIQIRSEFMRLYGESRSNAYDCLLRSSTRWAYWPSPIAFGEADACTSREAAAASASLYGN